MLGLIATLWPGRMKSHTVVRSALGDLQEPHPRGETVVEVADWGTQIDRLASG